MGFVIEWRWERVFTEYFSFPIGYHSTNASYSFVSPGRWTVDPLEAEIPQRRSPTAPGENKNKNRCKFMQNGVVTIHGWMGERNQDMAMWNVTNDPFRLVYLWRIFLFWQEYLIQEERKWSSISQIKVGATSVNMDTTLVCYRSLSVDAHSSPLLGPVQNLA